ncbi:MAG: hypothetical protein U1E67_08660, partial [Hyphomicrobiales bacterium]
LTNLFDATACNVKSLPESPAMAAMQQSPAYTEWPQRGRISPRLRKVFAGWNRHIHPAFAISE